MRLPAWLRRLLGLAADVALDKLGEAVNAPRLPKVHPRHRVVARPIGERPRTWGIESHLDTLPHKSPPSGKLIKATPIERPSRRVDDDESTPVDRPPRPPREPGGVR